MVRKTYIYDTRPWYILEAGIRKREEEDRLTWNTQHPKTS